MKASELIEALQKKIDDLGDCEVQAVSEEEGMLCDFWSVDEVDHDKYEEDGPLYIEINIELKREDD